MAIRARFCARQDERARPWGSPGKPMAAITESMDAILQLRFADRMDIS